MPTSVVIQGFSLTELYQTFFKGERQCCIGLQFFLS